MAPSNHRRATGDLPVLATNPSSTATTSGSPPTSLGRSGEPSDHPATRDRHPPTPVAQVCEVRVRRP